VPLIDDHGRLFGKINLIDATLAAFVLLLIPLAYGAFLLFRLPTPKITSLSPVNVAPPPGRSVKDTVVKINGENLRPYLRVNVGSAEAQFLLQSPSVAEIKLPDLPAGTYDVALFDEGQELFRKPDALTIVGPASLKIDVQTLGAFVGLDRATAALIAMESKFEPPVARVLALRPPEPGTQRVKLGANLAVIATQPGEIRVPAIIRLNCGVVNGECSVGGVAVAPHATISLPLVIQQGNDKPAQLGVEQLNFLIDEVRPLDAPKIFPTKAVATVHVRFVAAPEVVDVMKSSDVDVSGPGAEAPEERAILTEVGSDRQRVTALARTEGLLHHSLELQQPALAFTCKVRVPIVYTATGWSYKERPVKVGAPFTFETVNGAMMGWILDMTTAAGR
jgi:uncharacterized protein DUF4330/IPT/TIG domain-containing protein